MQRILHALGSALGCALGAYWAPAGEALECRATWCAEETPIAEAWDDASRRDNLAPGRGLPGLSWSDRGPVWIEDARDAEPARRGLITDAGLRAGLGVAVTAGRELLGAIELYARAPLPVGALAEDALRARSAITWASSSATCARRRSRAIRTSAARACTPRPRCSTTSATRC